MKATYLINDKNAINFKYGGQFNQRKEFDIRRAGRSSIPSLSINKNTQYLDATHNASLNQDIQIKTGLQYQFIENNNDNSTTNISPTIPDYISNRTSLFSTLKGKHKTVTYELGARYDLVFFNGTNLVKEIEFVNDTTFFVSTNLIKFEHYFHPFAVSASFGIKPSKNYKTTLNLGYNLRNPEINELYSSGLHQGVSAIEEGNANLNNEKSFKVLWDNEWRVKDQLFIQATGYFQHIQNYIYLNPAFDTLVTIRGAFLKFDYVQEDAIIAGTDILIKYAPRDDLEIVSKYALVRGRETASNLALINIPSDNLFASIAYTLPNTKSLHESYISFNGKYVFKQNKIEIDQDYLPPPDGYFLLGFSAGTNLQFKESQLKLNLRIENMLNTTYRDYLNRLRYFADEPGINVSLGLNYTF